jgi:hypothetical protein
MDLLIVPSDFLLNVPPIIVDVVKGIFTLASVIVFVAAIFFLFVAMANDGTRGRERARRCHQERKLEQERKRAAFYERRRTKREVHFELGIYQRELERAMSYAFRDEVERIFPDLSREEIHQRIDFLEAEILEQEKQQPEAPKQTERPPKLPDADSRITFAERCDVEKEKQALDFKKKNELSDTPELQYPPKLRQEFKRILAYWDDRKHEGPPTGWSKDKKGQI